MRYDGRRSLSLAGRWASATVALVVCTVGSATTLVVGRWSAILLLASVAVALGGYWWMVTAEARRPTLTLRAVVVAVAVVIGVAVTTVPRQSGDLWSYAMYGRIVAVHHASPYRHVPDEYPDDPMLRFVSPAWLHTGSVYGPTFVAFSAGVAPLAGDSATRTRLLYQATAALAVAGALVLVWRRTRSPAAIAWLGLNPVIGLQLVNGGRNDALIGLGVLGAILLAEREKLRASGFVTAVVTTIKATGLLAGAGLALWTWRRRGLRRASIFAAVTAVTVVGAYIAAGGTIALDPLRHAATQLSRGSVWSVFPRLGLPAISTTAAMVVTAAVVVVCLWRYTRDDSAEAGIAGPAAFLLAAPFVLPGYLGWVLPGAALRHNRRTARIIALQATLLVGAYEIFRTPMSGPVGDALSGAAGLLAPLLGIALLVAYLARPRKRPREVAGVGAPGFRDGRTTARLRRRT
jgi:glycosyl transferase family 87